MTARHQVLTLLAVALAVALGLVLGAGPVTEASVTGAQTARDRSQTRAAGLQARVERLQNEGAAAREVVRALAAPLVGDRLAGRTVLLVATPGAAPTDVRAARSAVGDAGATLTGILTLTDTYLDPQQAQAPLEDLALRLVPPGVEFADGATPIERVGTVLARAVVQRPEDGGEPDDGIDSDAAEVIAGLDELGALRLHGDPGLRAELAVLVTGAADERVAEAEAAVVALARALDDGSRGTVVAGPGDATEGPLRWVRDRDGSGLSGVGSVDHAATTAGRVGLALALAEQLDGGSGAYGTGRRVDGVIPRVGAQDARTSPAG